MIKIAASTYLNSAPLVYGFLHGKPRLESDFTGNEAPSRCADLLQTARVEAALIPSIEYRRIRGLRIVPSISVASKTSVCSVLLISHREIEEVSNVALDASSRTSAALVRILLERFYHLKPKYSTYRPCLEQMLKAHDAALLIGDPAMTADKTGFHVYDLASEWRKATGLPFVFAFWAVGADVNRDTAKRIAELCLESKEEGLMARETIAEEYSQRLGLDADSLKSYITENINYDLDDENLEGLRYFYQLAYECGMLTSKDEPEVIDL